MQYMNGLGTVMLAHFQMTRFKAKRVPLGLISSASQQHELNKTHLQFHAQLGEFTPELFILQSAKKSPRTLLGQMPV